MASDVIATEALSTLTTVFVSLLDGLEFDNATFSIRVIPTKIKLTGIGGLVATNEEPMGDIFGRIIDGQTVITIQAPTLEELISSSTTITQTLTCEQRESLRENGILKMEYHTVGNPFSVPRGVGNQTDFAQNVFFNVVYEFQKIPEDLGELIESVPVSLNIIKTGNKPIPLINLSFESDPWKHFTVFDDPAALYATPSNWVYNPGEYRFEQLSEIRGGQLTSNANKPGTYCVLKKGSAANFILSAMVRSDADDNIGLVFRFQDVNNFYFFIMDSQQPFRMVGKKVGGSFSMLDIQAKDDSNGYTIGQLYDIKVMMVDTKVEVSLNGQTVLSGEDSSITKAGNGGFLSRANRLAYFYKIKMIQI